MGSTNGSRRFIVLLNRAPHGPLTVEDIKVLLEQRMLRRNDLAMSVDDVDQQGKSSWKFLWQYPEFDRRSRRITEQPKIETPERRAETPPSEEALLPEELAAITAEELLFKAKPVPERALENIAPQGPREFDDPNPSSFGQAARWGVMAAILGTSFVVVTLFISFFREQRDLTARTPTSQSVDPAVPATQNSSDGPLSSNITPARRFGASAPPSRTAPIKPRAPEVTESQASTEVSDPTRPSTAVEENLDYSDEGVIDEEVQASAIFKKKKKNKKPARTVTSDADSEEPPPPEDEEAIPEEEPLD